MGSIFSTEEQDNPENQAMDRRKSDNSLQPKKLRKPGVTILKEILREIKLDESLIKENNELLKRFLSSFTEEMKKANEVFSATYQKPHFTGSFYSDLRISTPDEFDINLVLNLPFKPCDFEVQYHPQVPSYATYQLKNKEAAANLHPRLYKLLFVDGYLMPDKVRVWIQSVVDKAIMSYDLPPGIRGITPSSSGPARTIKLQKRHGIIDIDLVPVIECVLNTKQPGIDGQVQKKLGPTLKTFLVPKPYSPVGQCPVNEKTRAQLWRTHFPEAEEVLIHNIGCAKPVIKLLKLLRDKSQWKIIASYYLKTVVLWMLLENSSPEYWKEDKLYERFVDALLKLANWVKEKNIPYFFSKKHNLISKIKPDQAFNIHNRLCAIIKDVQSDPFKLWKYFNMEPTFSLHALANSL